MYGGDVDFVSFFHRFSIAKREYNNREIYLIKTRELTVIGVDRDVSSAIATRWSSFLPCSWFWSIAREIVTRRIDRRLLVKNKPASPHQDTFVYIYMKYYRMYVHYYITGGMRRNRRNSAARNLNEKDPDSRICTISLSLSISRSLSLSPLSLFLCSPLRFDQFVESPKGRRRGNVACCRMCSNRDRHFWIERAKDFHTTFSLVFTPVSLIPLTSYVLPLSFC